MKTIIILCREIDRNTGNIIAYPVCKDVNDGYNLFPLRLRSKLNPELSYWVARTDTDIVPTIVNQLRCRNLNERMLQKHYRCVRI